MSFTSGSCCRYEHKNRIRTEQKKFSTKLDEQKKTKKKSNNKLHSPSAICRNIDKLSIKYYLASTVIPILEKLQINETCISLSDLQTTIPTCLSSKKHKNHAQIWMCGILKQWRQSSIQRSFFTSKSIQSSSLSIAWQNKVNLRITQPETFFCHQRK